MQFARLDRKLNVTNAHLVKVPFDLPTGKRSPPRNTPTASPSPTPTTPPNGSSTATRRARSSPSRSPSPACSATAGRARPAPSSPTARPSAPTGWRAIADADGIVCLPPINKEQPAAARLRSLLAAAFGSDWSPSRERDLLAATGAKQTNLEDWLRDAFFEQHCKLFHNRPFIWHIWDGRKDGFHALVNYHRLDYANLQKLTYSYLGDWIRQQEADAKADKPGAAERLGAARALEAELVKILEGEPPYDIFVRWKPLKEQPIGWHPDLNDGVRLNIRPFMLAQDVGKKGAGILRAKPNIKWDKDRGKEPQRDKADYPWFWYEGEPPTDCPGGRAFTGNRWNNVHLTLARKRAARQTGD